MAAGVWLVEGPEIGFDYLGLRLPFPTRMTLVRLRDGALWAHSPVQPTEELFEAVERLGPVRFLVAPNTLHYWWIPEWKARFPAAETHAVPALRRRARRPLPIDFDLSDAPPPGWAGQIDQRLVLGGVLDEAVFFHRSSRTLVLTDLIENFEVDRVRKGWLRLLLRFSGARDPDGKAPIDMQLSFWCHRAALRDAVRQMIAWGPERVILAHGRWYPRDAVAELRRAFRWTGLR